MIKLGTGRLSLKDLRAIAREAPTLGLDPDCMPRLEHSHQAVQRILASGRPAYGINTGFGRLSQTRIPDGELEELQRNIVLSHAAGTGPMLDDATVRLTLALKIESLGRGFSGVRPLLVERLLELYNRRLYPRIPSKGSVGASGDLAPLAHLSLALLGVGEVQHPQPLKLAPKEGLALLNGTQVSTALALAGLFAAEDVFAAAMAAGALSVDAAAGSDTPFDARIHDLRGVPELIEARAHHLRLAAQAVRILHARIVLEVRAPDFAALQQREIVLRHVALAGVAAQVVNPGVERRVASRRGIDR